MTWRYGILKTKQKDGSDWYAIHEFYDDVDEIEKAEEAGISWTQDEIAAHGETPEEVIEVLEMMLRDAKSSPVHEATDD